MTRRKIREQIFKLLFQIEFYDENEFSQQLDSFFEEEQAENDDQEVVENQSTKEHELIKAKTRNIFENIDKIDAAINEKSVGWKTSRMGKVELAILRLGVYEITMDEDIPESVAINEAVELAKKFGEDNSSSFVNAVLAKFAS
ncbi:transcription antitermination factor NusB [Eubacterium oxidoreducens]|nr:transcription antitermination factor NusB [Eubacterium oxidoreducens]